MSAIEERSREFGVKLAKALRDHATVESKEHDLDVRYVMLGAAEYLRTDAEFRINPPIDSSRTDPEEREN